MLISNPEMCNHSKSYMIKCKCKSCLKIEQYCIKNYVSLEASCKHYDIKWQYYTCSKAQLNLLPYGILWNVQKIHAHQPGSLLPFTDELLWHVFESCKQEILVSSCIECHKALCHNFHGKSERAKANIIFRWLKMQSSKCHVGTHETQRSLVELAVDALDFMQQFTPK